MRDAPTLMNPHEYRTKMYEIFYKGESPEGPVRPESNRDNSTFASGKAELEALLAKGVGGPKPGMDIAGGEALSLSAENGEE